MPEFTMSGSPCSFKQQEEDELNPLCSSPLSLTGPRDGINWESSRCPHPIQWKVLVLLLWLQETEAQRLPQVMKIHQMGTWDNKRNVNGPTQQQLFSDPLSPGWHGYSSCVSFTFSALFPHRCIFSVPHYVCLFQSSFLCLLRTMLLFISLAPKPWQIESLMQPQALANRNLSCSIQACLPFQTPPEDSSMQPRWSIMAPKQRAYR